MTQKPDNPFKFWEELKRRKVVRVIIGYAAISFGIIELVNNIYEPLQLPPWTPTLVIVILSIGFPLAIIFAWIFDITSKGIKKTESLDDATEGNEIKSILDRSVVPEKSIIVLPFDNISSDPEQEYFSDGLTEEIITDLSHVNDLLVISRSSAMTFKKTNKTIPEIARTVNVRYVLEGSVRKEGNNLRMTAQLIDSVTDAHLWAEKYDGTLDNVFNIQEKVARSIASALKMKLKPEEDQKISKHYIDNIEIFECFLKARKELWVYTEESLIKAEKVLKDGLSKYGENEMFYTGLGQVYFQFYDSGIRYQEEYLNKIEEYANKIFKLNKDSEHAYRLLGLFKMKKENALSAFRSLYRSYEINPTNPDTLFWLSYIYSFHLGQPDSASPLIGKLIEIDPLNSTSYTQLAGYYWFKGERELALKEFQKLNTKYPDNILSIWYTAILLAGNNDTQGAIDLIDSYHKQFSEIFFYTFLLLFKFSLQQNKPKVTELFTDDIKVMAWNDFHMPWFMAECYALLGEKELALDWLDRAVDQGIINYPLLSEYDPFLENIRGETRFKKLMERVKHEWETFES